MRNKKYTPAAFLLAVALTGSLIGAHADEKLEGEAKPPAHARDHVGEKLAENPSTLQNTPIKVYLLVDGVGREVEAHPQTTARFLEEAGVKLGKKDEVSAPKDALVSDKQLLVVTRITEKVKTEESPVEFKVVRSNEAVECAPGEEETVTQEGEEGVLTEEWTTTYRDGHKVSKTKTLNEVTKDPVNEVVAPCLIPEPEPEPEPAPAPEPEPREDETVARSAEREAPPAPVEEVAEPAPAPAPPPPPPPSVGGTKADWMRAAGIPESEWGYVDYIVSRESGWNPNAVNPSSGACGLAQSLPCGKSEVYGAWNDPVASLKWQYDYVRERYGGYSGAAAHSRAYGWY